MCIRDRPYAVRNSDTLQAATVNESVWTYDGDTVWNSDVGKAGASPEGSICVGSSGAAVFASESPDTVGDGHVCQAGAVIERGFVYPGYVGADDQVGQTGAVVKR